MKKVYFEESLGNNDSFWNNNWQSSSIREVLGFCDIDPLVRILDRYLPKEGKILEGGCGIGQYVAHYHRKGYDIEGIDYSKAAIERILNYDKTLPVKMADVRSLPYPDNFFTAYYSGGVVEHFEEGPRDVLREAARVLKPGGVLLISVPYFNPVRSLYSISNFLTRSGNKTKIDMDNRNLKYILTSEHKKEHSPFPGYVFHKYCYKKNELIKPLKENNFLVLSDKVFNIGWGMRDIQLVRKLFSYKATGRKSLSSGDRDRLNSFAGFKGYLKKIIIAEKADNPLERTILYFLQRMFSNMILFTCRVQKNA